MTKINVVLIAETMEGGVRRHVMELINGLDTRQFSLTLIYGNRTDNTFLNNMDKLKSKAELINISTLTREINPEKDLKALIKIKKIIKTKKPDIVHCHSSKAGALGRVAAKLSGVKKVFYTPHAYSFENNTFSPAKRRLFITMERVFSKRLTTCTFNVSENEKLKAMSNGIDKEEKFKVIYNGIPEMEITNYTSLKEELNLPEDAYIIGNNGRLSDQKNPMMFMKIAKEVIEVNPKIHFVWAGDGQYHNQCMEFIESNQLKGNIHMLGFRDDAEYIVNDYDIFLITSGYEGLPYCLIEAMRASVPIVGFSDTGLEEFITQENGTLVSNKSEAVKMILNYTHEMTFSKESIYSYFLQSFSIDKMIKDLHLLYVT